MVYLDHRKLSEADNRISAAQRQSSESPKRMNVYARNPHCTCWGAGLAIADNVNNRQF
ncbi:hypothetical protein C7S14_4796 [Burkholderia cepacia]|nr:hypothetical protein C7S14_4796 [Burkholderia cepacia]